MQAQSEVIAGLRPQCGLAYARSAVLAPQRRRIEQTKRDFPFIATFCDNNELPSLLPASVRRPGPLLGPPSKREMPELGGGVILLPLPFSFTSNDRSGRISQSTKFITVQSACA
jgi:hypothetical protein